MIEREKEGCGVGRGATRLRIGKGDGVLFAIL